MCNRVGQIVLSVAGRDKGDVFCVVGEESGGRLLLADGKRRRAAHPKKKNPGHVSALAQEASRFDHSTIRKLQRGEPVSDRALRRALAAFKEGVSLGERRYD